MIEHYKRQSETADKAEKKLTSLSLQEATKEAEAADSEEDQLSRNQKVSLLSALLELGDWAHAKDLIDRMPEFYAVRYVEVAKSLSKLIHYLIHPLYKKYAVLVLIKSLKAD